MDTTVEALLDGYFDTATYPDRAVIVDAIMAALVVAYPDIASVDLATSSPGTPTTAFAGIASMAELQYALEEITFKHTTSGDTCELIQIVSDLGNNGLPVLYTGTPPTGIETPYVGVDFHALTILVGDTTAPEVTIDQGATQADPTSVSPVVFDVEFSEPVTGFAAGDVDLGGTAGGTLVAGVTGSGTTYTVSVTGMTTGGTVVASIGAGAADDAAGNPSEASTSTDNSVTWTEPDPADTTAPEVTIDQGATQADPTSVSPIVFDVVFSEPVTGLRRRRRRSRRDRGRHPRRRRHGLGHDVHGVGHRDDDRRHGRREHRRGCRRRCRGQPERGVHLDRQQRHLGRARPGRHDRPRRSRSTRARPRPTRPR